MQVKQNQNQYREMDWPMKLVTYYICVLKNISVLVTIEHQN